MATTHREIERKYDVDAGQALPSWVGFLDDLQPLSENQDLRAVYLDTRDLRLADSGITLRFRTGDDSPGWHLKLPVGKHERDEIQVPARGATDASAGPPAELTAMLRPVTGDAPLAPIVELNTARCVLRWTDAAGRDLLLITDDTVSARRLPEGEHTTWRELEVELGPAGDKVLMKRAHRALRSCGVRPADSASKLARALASSEPAAKPATGRTRPPRAGESAVAYLRAQLDAMRRTEIAVRRDAEDAVHQLRVAGRRARSTLQAYSAVLDRDRTRALTTELKWLAGVAGAVRDLEVLRARFTAALEAEAPENVLGPARARLDIFFAPRQAEARTRLIEALDSERYAALLREFAALLDAPPYTAAARTRATKVMPRQLAKAHRRVRRHLDAASGLPAGARRNVELHEARKAAKRLRYAAEAAEPALGKPARRLVTRTKVLQEVLGEHQDAVVAAPTLRSIAISAYRSGENAFSFGILYGRETAAALDEAGLAEAAKALRRAAGRAA